MPVQSQTFFTRQAQLLAEGHLSSMSRAYSTPLMVYLVTSQRWHLLQSRHAVLETFAAKYAGVKAAGIGSLRACVTREHVSDRGRLEADVAWFYIGPGGRKLGRTCAKYFLNRHDDGFRVEMIEFKSIAFPQLHGWFAANSDELHAGARLPF